MPLSAQASISLCLMGREASEMSVSPLQNFSKPPPVPETPTVTRTSGATERNSSATASVTGKTVLEPSIATLPDSDSPLPVVSPPSSPPHAPISSVAARASMTSGSSLLHRIANTLSYLLGMSPSERILGGSG